MPHNVHPVTSCMRAKKKPINVNISYSIHDRILVQLKKMLKLSKPTTLPKNRFFQKNFWF